MEHGRTHEVRIELASCHSTQPPYRMLSSSEEAYSNGWEKKIAGQRPRYVGNDAVGCRHQPPRGARSEILPPHSAIQVECESSVAIQVKTHATWIG